MQLIAMLDEEQGKQQNSWLFHQLQTLGIDRLEGSYQQRHPAYRPVLVTDRNGKVGKHSQT